jgi:hypothetical protein
MVFPLYHVLADAAEWRPGELVAVTSSSPMRVTALAVRDDAGLHLLVANLEPNVQAVQLDGLGAGTLVQRRLSTEQASDALLDPVRYRAAAPHTIGAAEEGASLVLQPFEVVRLDVRHIS